MIDKEKEFLLEKHNFLTYSAWSYQFSILLLLQSSKGEVMKVVSAHVQIRDE